MATVWLNILLCYVKFIDKDDNHTKGDILPDCRRDENQTEQVLQAVARLKL